MRRFLITLLIVAFCISLVGCGSSKSLSMIGKWEMSNESDTIIGAKFDETLTDDQKSYMIFDEDNSFVVIGLGFLETSGSWKLFEDKFLICNFDGQEISFDITVESDDILLMEYLGEYFRLKRVD